MRTPLCGIVIGEAKDQAEAERIATTFRDCPYCAQLAALDKLVNFVFFIPEEQRWWLEFVEKAPKDTFSLERARVFFVEGLTPPRSLKEKLPEPRLAEAPCGARCDRCPSYKDCLGCPATIYFKGHKRGENEALRA
jgi:hypothetical protein